jgi:hypothetical protein
MLPLASQQKVDGVISFFLGWLDYLRRRFLEKCILGEQPKSKSKLGKIG